MNWKLQAPTIRHLAVILALRGLFSGRGREAGWLTYGRAVVLVVYFVFVRSRMG